jgi:hypothetical protein
VLRLLDDRELAKEFGAEGRRRIETSFSLDAMTNAYLGLYRRLADGRPGATVSEGVAARAIDPGVEACRDKARTRGTDRIAK